MCIHTIAHLKHEDKAYRLSGYLFPGGLRGIWTHLDPNPAENKSFSTALPKTHTRTHTLDRLCENKTEHSSRLNRTNSDQFSKAKELVIMLS